MIINTLAQLTDVCAEATEAAGCDPVFATAVASVIARHAMGQGLKYCDDWGWILEMYDPERIREICREAGAAGW
jgi:hypothetical protein